MKTIFEHVKDRVCREAGWLSCTVEKAAAIPSYSCCFVKLFFLSNK